MIPKSGHPVKRPQTPVVALRRVRCPKCGSIYCPVQKTLESGSELLSQRRTCKHCGQRFVTIFD